MKNDMKIILGAIVVILLLLVGAYALSGSSPQPTVTPTVTPVTATPTPVPGGSTPTPAPTVAPTVAPTATPEPTVTPTPVPESGVKLTEFGYWITYPPLGPQKWSTNPRPYVPPVTQSNIVYFDPTSGSIRFDSLEPTALDKSEYIQTTVYRVGDLNGTVNVVIHATTSDNIGVISYLSSDYEYYFSMHTKDDENMTEPNVNDDYVLTFGPGVSEQYLCLHINSYYEEYDAQQSLPEDGWVQLTITDADGGYSIGSQDQYMLSLTYLTEVRFGTWDEEQYYGSIYAEEVEPALIEDFGIGYKKYVDHIANNDSFVDVFIPIAREYGYGEMTVYFIWDDVYGDFDAGDVIVAPFTFPNGDTEGLVKVSIPKQYVLDSDNNNGVSVYIADSDDYIPIEPSYFNIFINDYAN